MDVGASRLDVSLSGVFLKSLPQAPAFLAAVASSAVPGLDAVAVRAAREAEIRLGKMLAEQIKIRLATVLATNPMP